MQNGDALQDTVLRQIPNTTTCPAAETWGAGRSLGILTYMNSSTRRTISRVAAIAIVVGASALSTAAHAQITFDWTLNGHGYSESGKLITASGSLVGGNAPAGDYTASNWIVTGSSANPGLVGASVSGGQLTLKKSYSFQI